MNIGEIAQKETAGLPNWVWAGVIVIGLGIGFTVNHLSRKKKETQTDDLSNSGNKSHSGHSPSNAVSDAYPLGDALEGGFPIMASQTNTSLPYAGLPANSYAIINQGGLSGIPVGMMIGDPYPWRHYRHHKHHRHKGEHRRMHEHNLEGHGHNPRGGAVAARVGGH